MGRWPSAVVAALALLGCGRGRDPDREVDSSSLKDIAVLATLDAPIPAGKSAVWCGSFGIAWSRLAKDVVKGPPRIRGAEELCGRLNAAAVGENDLPPGSFYAAAGWITDGIAERIRKDMAASFPAVPPPDLGGPDTAAVAYAYLEASVKFDIRFFDNREPLVFKDSVGKETKVKAFGIRKEDASKEHRLREQVDVLFADPGEFVIDPCRSTPIQIVLARVPAKGALSETLSYVEGKVAERHSGDLGMEDILLVPDIAFRLLHRFRELEGPDKGFLNAGMEAYWIEKAFQSILFRLDKSGAELKSEAIIAAPAAAKPSPREQPREFLFDRPFLVYLKKRGGGKPFFSLWIDGAELLEPW